MDLLITVLSYIGIAFAIMLTLIICWFVFIGKMMLKMSKRHDEMSERIKSHRELNGRATKHRIDLDTWYNEP